MFASGELKALIDQGLRGMTSNPTIFEKAIGHGNDYDGQLRSLIGKVSDAGPLFEALAVQDIRSACDAFRALYDSTHGADGYVSLEVSPTLARDTRATIDAAARLWKEVDRPNVMIKIPGTPEGVPAVRASIAAGINVNVTLLFSVDAYEAAAQAYVDGVNDRDALGHAARGDGLRFAQRDLGVRREVVHLKRAGRVIAAAVDLRAERRERRCHVL
jgi:transaldolase / glucose-6-phosphate isomerase